MATTPEPNNFAALCADVIRLTPQELGDRAWYLIIATVLTSSPNPSSLGSFYTYLSTPSTHPFPLPLPADCQTSLPLLFRDLLLKLVTLTGVPPVIVAISSLATAESRSPQTASQSSRLSPQYQNLTIPTLITRGRQTINSIYGPTLLPQIFASFGSHSRDIEHMELAVVYGMFLSDHTVLNPLETEVVVLVAMLCTGLRAPSLWHMRGLARLLGLRGTGTAETDEGRKEVVRGVKRAAINVVEFCGEGMERKVSGVGGWPDVRDVLGELGGFGDDELNKLDKLDELNEAQA